MNVTVARDALQRWSEYLPRYRKADGLIGELDLTVYLLLLLVQDLFAEPGDIAELGVFRGGPFALLCSLLRPGERAFAIDVFDLYLGRPGPQGDFGNPPDVFRQTVARIAAGAPPYVLVRADTTIAALAGEVRRQVGRHCRFFHVDGGHDLGNVRADLAIARDCVADHPTPLLVVDDTFSPRDPAVTEGLLEFLRDSGEFVPFLITPAKTVLCRTAAAAWWAKFAAFFFRDGIYSVPPGPTPEYRFFAGAPCLVLRPEAKPELRGLDLRLFDAVARAEFSLPPARRDSSPAAAPAPGPAV